MRLQVISKRVSGLAREHNRRTSVTKATTKQTSTNWPQEYPHNYVGHNAAPRDTTMSTRTSPGPEVLKGKGNMNRLTSLH
ncbi:hypothetical protein BgiMline_000256 [Biomphalaria glabrata]